MLVLKDTPSHISIDSLGLYLCIYRMFVKFSLKPQAFIQALLSTAIFPQRFIFFTVYLVQWSYGVDPEWTLKRRLLEFSTFIQSLLSTPVFPPKIHFLYCLLSSVVPQGGPIVDIEEKVCSFL